MHLVACFANGVLATTGAARALDRTGILLRDHHHLLVSLARHASQAGAETSGAWPDMTLHATAVEVRRLAAGGPRRYP